MTSYKKIAEECGYKLQESMHEIDVLRSQLEIAQKGLFEELSMHLDNKDAKEVLRIFSSRAQNREELVLLIRALAKLG